MPAPSHYHGDEIAIVGMACRLPGAATVEQFWQNLRDGVESITFLDDDASRAAGATPEELADPAYVRSAGGVLEGIDQFDADFFGLTPREAEIADPQHRLFLESAHEALERAGVDPERYDGLIGVFAGEGRTNYLLQNLQPNPAVLEPFGPVAVTVASDKDFLPLRLSYTLDLKGPSVNVQTACSTSLVATHMACQSLIGGDCDVAIAGGVSITTMQPSGYLWEEGGIYSKDGHCRAFDASASGMVGGNGLALVVLKRFEDAERDGDTIWAVIRGSAINNDGSDKVGFTAPAVGGQARAIADALAMAQVDARSIGYVEAHGTGTPLGDPIEVAALTQAFREHTEDAGYCGLGSVKSSIGHCNAAAGVASLIKTALCLHHRELVASLHFERPNPDIDFASSPFAVVTERRGWERGQDPRRAGVSSFGMGGTNAHVVVEEAPDPLPVDPARSHHLLVVSAATEAAAGHAADQLAAHLEATEDPDLADVAHTLQTGRRAMPWRRVAVAADRPEAVAALRAAASRRSAEEDPGVALLFPGQGAQYPLMGRQLYDRELIFRAALDACAETLTPELGLDLRTVVYPAPDAVEGAAARLQETAITQPALFAVEYALSRLWQSFGVEPAMLLGHSVGEFVAACLAGTFSLEGALRLVAARGRLMQALPGGDMLSVGLSESDLTARLPAGVAIAAVNGPASCVASGPTETVGELARALEADGVPCRALHTSHAFHSPMMDSIVEPFVAMVRDAKPQAPSRPAISSVTGQVVAADTWTDPEYWGRNLRQPVRFFDAARTLLTTSHTALECGPGRTLATLVRQAGAGDRAIATSLRHPTETADDLATALGALGELWQAGVAVDWETFRGEARRRRVALPTYPFERRRFWVDGTGATAPAKRRTDRADWMYAPLWRELPPSRARRSPRTTLCFADEVGLATQLAPILGSGVVVVRPGEAFAANGEREFAIRPGSLEDMTALFAALRAGGKAPDHVLYLWTVVAETGWADDDPRGVATLMTLARELAADAATETHVDVVTDDLFGATDEGGHAIDRAAGLGIGMVAPLECAHLTWRHVDVHLAETEAAAQLARELRRADADPRVALRNGRRWAPTAGPAPIDPAQRPVWRDGGVYLITGGRGGIGHTLAMDAAAHPGTALILVSRSASDDNAVAPLRERGARVMVAQADVADRDAMTRIVADATREFGAIHGVIHAAGVNPGGVLALRTPQDAEAVLAPKVRGTRILADLVADQPIDFFALCSSLNSILGAAGAADYCGANAFLDAFATAPAHRDLPLVAIGWDAWSEVGMAATTETSTAQSADRAHALALGIKNDEGVDVFHRAVASGRRCVWVSTHDLADRMTAAATPPAEEAVAEVTTTHDRPALQNDYVAPGTDTEIAMAAIVCELLGIQQAGTTDNLFDLGFDSLLAHRLVTRLKQQHKIALPIGSVLKTPFIGELAQFVDLASWAATMKKP